jgi:hypothetical protein
MNGRHELIELLKKIYEERVDLRLRDIDGMRPIDYCQD